MGQIKFKGKGIVSIQDGGRKGYRAFGVPVSGFMDRQSAWKANWLAGNEMGAPLFECFYGGQKFYFSQPCVVGICGAAEQVRINDDPISTGESIFIKRGDELTIDSINRGFITYVAVGGKIHAEEVLHSMSTYVPSKIGGHKGRNLQKGDIIKVEERIGKKRKLPEKWERYISSQSTLRYIKGPEFHILSEYSKKQMNRESFYVDTNSNRMGYRLEGVKLEFKKSFQIPSSPVVPGTIQLPEVGSPIVIMADGQTTGGYPRIGSIVDADLDDLTQIAPGNKVRFQKIEMEEADRIYREWMKKFHQETV